MQEWAIRILYLGKITANLSLIWPIGLPPIEEDFSISIPYLGFLLQNGTSNTLVDTGISERFIIDGKAWGGLPAEGGQSFLKKALEKEGVSPDDIDRVVYTHLHNDHAANCKLLAKAKFVFQKDEWKNLVIPLPVQEVRRDYDHQLVDEIKSMNVLMIDGDLDLEDGIKLYKTPGHSMGSQSVAVNTRKGVVVLVGDLSLLNFMMFPETTEILDMHGKSHKIPPISSDFGPAVPHLLIYNFYDFYDSIYKVKAVVSREEPGFIIPGHEPSLLITGI